MRSTLALGSMLAEVSCQWTLVAGALVDRRLSSTCPRSVIIPRPNIVAQRALTKVSVVSCGVVRTSGEYYERYVPGANNVSS